MSFQTRKKFKEEDHYKIDSFTMFIAFHHSQPWGSVEESGLDVGCGDGGMQQFSVFVAEFVLETRWLWH